MNIHGKKALVTGATGYIGGQIAKRLQSDEDVQVRALVRTPSKGKWLADIGVELVQGDITDPASVQQALQDCQLVFHAAAYVGEQGKKEDVWAVNVGGTQNVAEAAVAQSIERFVHLSSCAVYGSLQQMDIDESTPTRMTGRVYHDSKVAAEQIVLAAHKQEGLPIVSARISQVYGPGSPQFTIRVIESVKAGKVVLIDGGKHYFKPAYIDNLVDALVLCAQVDEAVGEALNITDGYVVAWRDFFERYGRMVGIESFPSAPYAIAYGLAVFKEIKGRISGRPTSLNREVIKTFRSDNSFSNAKARRLLGWTPEVGFEEGIERTEVWLRQAGYLD